MRFKTVIPCEKHKRLSCPRVRWAQTNGVNLGRPLGGPWGTLGGSISSSSREWQAPSARSAWIFLFRSPLKRPCVTTHSENNHPQRKETTQGVLGRFYWNIYRYLGFVSPKLGHYEVTCARYAAKIKITHVGLWFQCLVLPSDSHKVHKRIKILMWGTPVE